MIQGRGRSLKGKSESAGLEKGPILRARTAKTLLPLRSSRLQRRGEAPPHAPLRLLVAHELEGAEGVDRRERVEDARRQAQRKQEEAVPRLVRPGWHTRFVNKPPEQVSHSTVNM